MSEECAAVLESESAWMQPFGDCVRGEVPLAPMTTIRIGGVARWLLEPRSAAAAAAALRAIRSAGLRARVLGGGSNLLVSGARFDGVVVHPVRINHVEFRGSTVTAGAGTTLSSLIAKTTDAGLAGLEVLAGIPGQIGGAVAMNAGGRYGEIGSVVDHVEVATPDGRVEAIAGRDLRFSYRHSDLPAGSIVVTVTFALTSGDRRELKSRAGGILKAKNAAQPTGAWNFGCMFKNPRCGSAGRLVESCGLKGLSHGGARISPIHGNFVENLGSATFRDVLDLMEIAEDAVRDRHGVALEREVKVWAS